MATIQTNPHIPTFILLPVDNNRTAWRGFNLPMILMETDRRDLSGAPLNNSGVIVQNCDCGGGVECDCMGIKTTTCNEFCNGAAIRIVIEDVPHKALVAGQIPIGLMSPDHEIFAKNISMTEMIDRMIHPEMQTFWRITSIDNKGIRQWAQIDFPDAIAGDLMQYTTASGHTTSKELLEIDPATNKPYPRNVIPYYPTANYYDLSDIAIETEQLPPDWYNLAYQAEYYARVESQSTPGQLNCIDPTRKATSVFRFRLNHPGQVMQETVKLTPAPYMTSDQKSVDTTIEFYRPFTDILQDIFDEQYLLGSVNWVDYITPQFVPYLSYLLGLDLPYFPQSLYKLRKTMLRNVARLQQLKGSRNAIYDLFQLFGYIVYVNKLYWSADGKRLIRPGEKLPPAYSDQEITIEERCQVEPVLVGYNTSGFGQLTVPLLYRPTYTEELQGIVNVVQGGDVTFTSYLVRKNALGAGTVSTSQTTDLNGTGTTFLTDFAVGDTIIVTGETIRSIAAITSNTHLTVTVAFQNITTDISYTYVSKTYKRLEEIACGIGTAAIDCNNDPGNYDPIDCTVPIVPTDGLESWSKVVIDKSAIMGNPSKDTSTGDPTFIYNGVSIDRAANLLHLTFNGAIQFDDKYGQQGANAPNSELLLYAFATYHHEELSVPDKIKNLFSNRFDIQLLTQDGAQIGGDILEFLIDYLFKIKAFHSLLHTLIYHADLNETYQVTQFCVGGDIEQRYNIDAGKLQVPPAIDPRDPIDDCYRDPSDLGYKPEDIALRKKILDNLPNDEFQAWVNAGRYLEQPATIDAPTPIYVDRDVIQDGAERLAPTPAADSVNCKFTYLGQDRLVPGDKTEHEDVVYDPTPISNTPSIASQSSTDLSPITDESHGTFYPTGAAASSNNDSSEYSAFNRDFSTVSKTFCNLDGISDYCYKGRVDDELLCRMTLMNTEQYQATICQIGFGSGIYYAFPSTSELTNSIQGPALQQSYSTNLVPSNNNFLDRLLRAYDTVQGENVHFTNRPYLIDGVSGESNLLALQRSGLGVQIPLMHFPGTRFATINKLESDFVHPKWSAKPWDDQYSSSCGPYNQSCKQPTYLNARLVESTDGDTHLVFDSMPFIIIANRLQPDIPSFGSHIIDTNSNFQPNDVVHGIYTSQPMGAAAITLESTYTPTRSVTSNKINYTVGGAVWTFGRAFDRAPTITVGIELLNLADDIYTLSAKIVDVTETSTTIKVYKLILGAPADLVFSECAADDVIVHIRACVADDIIITTNPLFTTAGLCVPAGTDITVPPGEDVLVAEIAITATISGTRPDPDTGARMSAGVDLYWDNDPFNEDAPPNIYWLYSASAFWYEPADGPPELSFILEEDGGREFTYLQMLPEDPWFEYVPVPEAGTITCDIATDETTVTWHIIANINANKGANVLYIIPGVYVDESGYGRLSLQVDMTIKKNDVVIGTYTTTRTEPDTNTWAEVITADGTVVFPPAPSPSPEPSPTPEVWTCQLEAQWGTVGGGIGVGVRADFNFPYNVDPVVAGYSTFDSTIVNVNNQPSNFSETGEEHSAIIEELSDSTKGIHGYGTWVETSGSDVTFEFRTYLNGELYDTQFKTITDGTTIDALWLTFDSSTGVLDILNP